MLAETKSEKCCCKIHTTTYKHINTHAHTLWKDKVTNTINHIRVDAAALLMVLSIVTHSLSLTHTHTHAVVMRRLLFWPLTLSGLN